MNPLLPTRQLTSSEVGKSIILESRKNDQELFIQVDCGCEYHPTSFMVLQERMRKPLSLYIVPKGLHAHYLAAVLNSRIGYTFMFGKSENTEKLNVNKTRIINVPIVELPLPEQQAIGKCNEVLQFLDKMPENFANARFFHLVEDRFFTLREIMIAEAYMRHNQLFSGESLVSFWITFLEQLQTLNFENIAVVYTELFRKSNPLRNKIEAINIRLNASDYEQLAFE